MAKQDLWVFGYGSLMWSPEFEYGEKCLARLDGYRRAFCMWSIHHRGSEENPGLVLALDEKEGSTCTGVAFRVSEDQADQTLMKLRERELISSAYFEINCPITLDDGRNVSAVCYVIDRDHAQYCGDLGLEKQAQIIAKAVGGRGPNTEYLFNTATYMVELGLEDYDMMWLQSRVEQLV